MPTSALPAAIVNFSRFRLETHVRKALQKAWALSSGRPLGARDLLKGALLVARTHPSAAFQKAASLLPLPSLEDVTTAGPPLDLAAVPLTRPLAGSFSVAEGFLGAGQTVWGRDYVTLALLAKDDPSLAEIAREAGTSVEDVRREWLDFVREGSERRTPEAWQRWWHGAAVPSPAEERAAAGAAYLFTWNPTRFPFPKLDRHVRRIEEKGSTAFRWSTGNRTDVSPGTRVFLLRQGAEPRGLVGVGEIKGAVVKGPHWDARERKKGEESRLVEVLWTALAREPFLDLPRLVQETGDSTVWSTRSGGIELERAVALRLEEVWPSAWARHAHRLPQEVQPEGESRQWIARFDPDRGGRDDSLNVERYVDAFARVMASRSLTPPLSVGLFGDWGSGKTFFMDRLRARVDELSGEADGAESLYWPRICQIQFNAWHYAETNLWASLVSTIFNQLRLFLDGPKEDADEFNRLLNQLELAGELRREAEKRLAEAKTRHEEAVSRLAEAEKQLRELPAPPAPSDEKLRAILKRSLAEFLGRDSKEIVGLLESAARWSGRPEFKEAAERVRKGEETLDSARALLDEAQALSSRVGFWWRVLSGARLSRTRGFWIVIATIVAIPLALGAAHRTFGLSVDWAHTWTLIGQGLTIGGASVAWARSRLAGAGSVFDRLGSLQAKVARGIEEARDQDRLAFEAKREDARAKEAEARAELARLRGEEERAAEAERKAREALRESTSEARLGRFIRERASSADYEKHLGLIAMIHRDFNRLSELMEAARASGGDPQLPRVDRIILYIDDLDRCHPPERVVRVLEAVHLLLFFPLFVVIVGVDSRWVSRSLYRHYEGMLADEAMTGPTSEDAERAPAESQDFLEKIFQVPFWLRRMEPAAVQRLIHSLISAAEIETPASPVVAAAPPPADGAPDLPEAPGRPAHTATTPGEAPGRAMAKRTTVEAESQTEAVGEPLAAPGETLTITEAELRFMDEVAPLMPRTPRAVKRFVNIYRLYKAALSPPAYARFVGTAERPGNFRAVQVLLALVTGAPRFAQRVFGELQGDGAGSGKRLSHLVKALEGGEETWRTTLDALREFAREENDLELDALREVSTLVGRYSVHHMVSAAPGEAGLG
jgi:hypothetical protein